MQCVWCMYVCVTGINFARFTDVLQILRAVQVVQAEHADDGEIAAQVQLSAATGR